MGLCVCVSVCVVGGRLVWAASAPIQICLIGFDSHNYRVIMAFSSGPRRSERQLLHAAACCQMVCSGEGAGGGGAWGSPMDFWLSSGY